MRKWIWRVVGLAVAAGVLWLVGSIIAQTRHSHLWAENKSRLKQILRGLHQYHDAYGVFPPAYVTDASGHRLHSWRVLLLPYLGQEELYHEYDFSQPWDSPGNLKLKDRIPRVYRSPDELIWTTGKTSLLAVVESRCAWPGPVAASLADFKDEAPVYGVTGPESTIGLISVPAKAQVWLAPEDIGFNAAAEAILNDAPSAPPATQIGFMDGRIGAISRHASRDVAFSLLTRDGGKPYPGVPIEQMANTPRDLPPLVEIERLRATEIVATPFAPLRDETNTLYCCTFQIAWDKLKDRLPSDRVKLQTDLTLVDQLNHLRFPLSDLDPSSYFAAFGDPAREQSMFQGQTPGVRKPIAERATGAELACVSSLIKSLKFRSEFIRLMDPLQFQERGQQKAVRAFGVIRPPQIPATPLGVDDLYGQVLILDYLNDKDFVIQLNTQSPRDDRIILGRIPRGASLEACWQEIQRRSGNPHPGRGTPQLNYTDRLEIPVLLWNIQKTYGDLENQQLISVIPELPQPQKIHSASQVIGFRLDEAGAELMSWSELRVMGENGHIRMDETTPRKLIFDEPYFLGLQEGTASRPYFMAWIENAELMERKTEPPRHGE